MNLFQAISIKNINEIERLLEEGEDIFQVNDRTLTDHEINKEIKEITNSALSIKSVSLPWL